MGDEQPPGMKPSPSFRLLLLFPGHRTSKSGANLPVDLAPATGSSSRRQGEQNGVGRSQRLRQGPFSFFYSPKRSTDGTNSLERGSVNFVASYRSEPMRCQYALDFGGGFPDRLRVGGHR